jgi:hypothetical protein
MALLPSAFLRGAVTSELAATRDDPAARVVDPGIDAVPERERPDRCKEREHERDAHLHHLRTEYKRIRAP